MARLGKRDFLDWKEHVEKHGRKDREGNVRAAALATVNRKLAAVRSFVRWAQELGLASPFDPPKPRKRHGRRKPKSLEPEERKALLKAVERGTTPGTSSSSGSAWRPACASRRWRPSDGRT